MKYMIALATSICVVVFGLSPTCEADDVPELELRPCTIELVGGEKIDGKLAVQFDMDDHLIVYSPRLATVRSFLKDHVHALTVDDKREELNPKRELTDEDRKLLGQVTWPDEPPTKGRKPAYTTEKWEEPKQLLVWAEPGRSGQFEEPTNWLLNGQPMTEWPRPTGVHYGFVFFEKDGADFLFPASAKNYTVRPRRTNARARHITAEAGTDAEIKLNNCTGNIWVSAHGSFNGGGGAQLGGGKHTFFINGRPYVGEPPTDPQRFAELMTSAKHFARKWVVRKDDPNASITLIGTIRSGDETHWYRGVTILEENSVISIGPRCVQTIGANARFIMRSGSVLGKNHNQLYKNDMLVRGELLAGTHDKPITRNCYLGISIKDSKGRAATGDLAKRHARGSNVRGLTVAPGGQMRVHTTDPAEARLVVTWHGTEPGGDDGGSGVKYDSIPEPERTINVNFFGDQTINDILFDYLGEGDVRLLNPEIVRSWKRVDFGGNNTAENQALFAGFHPGQETQEQIVRWREESRREHLDEGYGAVAQGLGARNPRMIPSGGTFAAGETVKVRLQALGDPEIRYVMDAGDSQNGQVYTKPLMLTETTTVKAGCYHHPGPHFYKQWGQISDTFAFVGQIRQPDRGAQTEPGLELCVFESKGLDQLHTEPGELLHTQTVEHFELDVPEDREKKADGYVYAGYIEVAKSGLHRFYTKTEGASRLYIGDRLVVDNHRRYRYDWKPAGKTPLESWGSLNLGAGKHAIRLEYARGNGFAWWEPQEKEPFTICYEGPGIEKQPIPAGVLSHGTDSTSKSKIQVYPAPTGKGSLLNSEVFNLKVDGKTVDVYQVRVLKPHTWAGDYGPQQYEHAAMAYFDFEGAVDVEITADTAINSVIVRPLRCGIQPTVRGSTIRFSLSEPGQHSIEINGDITHNLQLFTNPIERDKPQRTDPNVRFFGPGIHFPADGGIEGAIQLRSNETIYIAGGAIVHGAIQTPCHEKIHNATICGRGILLGQSDTVHKRGLAKIGFDCEGIAIKDIHLIDSYGWVLEVAWATDVLIENVKVIAYRGNSDGIDIASCRDVVVKDCYIRSADDNLVVINAQYDPTLKNFHVGPEGYATHYGKMFKDMEHQGLKRNTSNIVFRDCILWQDRDNPDPIHVGWSMRGREIRNVHFKDIDILHTRGGPKTAQLDIDTSWWGDKDNLIHDIVFENIRMEDAHGGNVIHIRQINQPATVRNVLFKNIRLLGGDVRKSSIIVSAPGSRIENITFENVFLFDKRIRSLEEAGISIPEKYCENITVK